MQSMSEAAGIADFMRDSDSVFFQPTDRFWEEMDNPWFRYRRVRDFGCGLGTLTKEFRLRGWRDTLAYDMFVRDGAVVDDVIECDVIADSSEVMLWRQVTRSDSQTSSSSLAPAARRWLRG